MKIRCRMEDSSHSSRYKSAGGEKISVKCGSTGPSRVALGHPCPRRTRSQPPFWHACGQSWESRPQTCCSSKNLEWGKKCQLCLLPYSFHLLLLGQWEHVPSIQVWIACHTIDNKQNPAKHKAMRETVWSCWAIDALMWLFMVNLDVQAHVDSSS